MKKFEYKFCLEKSDLKGCIKQIKQVSYHAN